MSMVVDAAVVTVVSAVDVTGAAVVAVDVAVAVVAVDVAVAVVAVDVAVAVVAVVGAATSPLEAHPARRATVSSQTSRRESTGSV
jgi:hypothetical protein